MFDTLFCNARIVDGTGTPWFWGSLGVQDGFVEMCIRDRY